MLMKILIRRVRHRESENDLKISERYTINTTYEFSKRHSILFYPISEFSGSKCMCGKDAMAMTSDFKVVCKDCINDVLGESKLKQEKMLAVPSITQAVRGNAFEWAVQGKDEFYKVKGANVLFNSNQRISAIDMRKRFGDIMTLILEDKPQLVDADYNKYKKELTIFV